MEYFVLITFKEEEKFYLPTFRANNKYSTYFPKYTGDIEHT